MRGCGDAKIRTASGNSCLPSPSRESRESRYMLWSPGRGIRILNFLPAPELPMLSDDDPLAEFDLPPEVMSSTFEHAISDAASITHERGHAVASALQRKLKGSIVEFGFPGTVTAHLKSGVVARCGGPALGWRIEVEREPGAEVKRINVDVAPTETDAKLIAEALAKVLKRW